MGDAVSTAFGLIQAGGGVWHLLPSSREMLRKKGHPHTTINRRLVQLATPLTRPVRRFSITGNVVSPGFCLI